MLVTTITAAAAGVVLATAAVAADVTSVPMLVLELLPSLGRLGLSTLGLFSQVVCLAAHVCCDTGHLRGPNVKCSVEQVGPKGSSVCCEYCLGTVERCSCCLWSFCCLSATAAVSGVPPSQVRRSHYGVSKKRCSSISFPMIILI